MLAYLFRFLGLNHTKMKNEKNKPQDKDQLKNQRTTGTEIEQRQDSKLKKEQRTAREEDELEDQDFESESEWEEGDDVEQGRSTDKFGRTEGRQQDTTKNQDPSQRKGTDKGGSDKGGRKY